MVSRLRDTLQAPGSVTQKINNVQVLRAVGAIAVVYGHTFFVFWKFASFGAFGVNLFFIISGFIITMISADDRHAFFKRRIIRIVPLYWSFTFLTFFSVLLLPQYFKSTRATLPDLLKSLFFIPYAKTDGTVRPILFLGWTLNYEIFFYAVVAACLRIFRRHVSVFTSVVLLLVMFICHFWAERNLIAWFYSRPIILDFLVGIGIFYLIRIADASVIYRWRYFIAAICLTSLFSAILVQGLWPNGRFGSLLISASCTVLVLTAVLLSKAGWNSDVVILSLIGDASYALYLIHTYLEEVLNRVLGHRFPFLATRNFLGMIIALSMSIVAAIAVHLWFERPVTRYLRRKFDSGPKAKPSSTDLLSAPASS